MSGCQPAAVDSCVLRSNDATPMWSVPEAKRMARGGTTPRSSAGAVSIVVRVPVRILGLAWSRTVPVCSESRPWKRDDVARR